MIEGIKKIMLSMLTGASFVTALAMIAVGYSDRLDPVDYPLLACLGLAFPAFVVANLIVFGLWLIVKWKWAWIPLAGFAIAYEPIRTYFPIHFNSTPKEGVVKVLSYNACGYGGNWQHDNAPKAILNYLKQVDADIVCIQEAQTTKIDHRTFFADVYQYTDTVHINGRTNSIINAVGIHSRFPILRKERIEYKSSSNGSVAFYLQIEGDTVIVINNHLESTHLSNKDRRRYKDVLKGNMNRNDAEEETMMLVEKISHAMVLRSYEARAVHEYIDSHRQYPIIVCGDFNDSPISYTRHTVAQGLQDCFVESGNGAGISYNAKGFNFRIDHILCSKHFEPLKCTVDNQVDFSDHYPICCWLKWKEKEGAE